MATLPVCLTSGLFPGHFFLAHCGPRMVVPKKGDAPGAGFPGNTCRQAVKMAGYSMSRGGNTTSTSKSISFHSCDESFLLKEVQSSKTGT